MPSNKKYISEELELEHKNVVNEAINQIIESTYSRETRGRKPTGKNEDTKAYHKITISMTQLEKDQIHEAAKQADMSVSQLIRDILKEKNVLK